MAATTPAQAEAEPVQSGDWPETDPSNGLSASEAAARLARVHRRADGGAVAATAGEVLGASAVDA